MTDENKPKILNLEQPVQALTPEEAEAALVGATLTPKTEAARASSTSNVNQMLTGVI